VSAGKPPAAIAPLLAGQVALVAGASRGIGRAVADALYGAGAHVVGLARTLVDRTTDRRMDVRCDLTDPSAVERVVQRLTASEILPDILVNSAGVFFLKSLEATSPPEFGQAIATNLTGPFLLARLLVPVLKLRRRGHLVTIGSVADHTAFPGNAAYGASKFGLRGLHEVLAAELAGSGVRTTLISPGAVDTAMWDAVSPDAAPGLPNRKDMLRVEDVAAAVLYAVTQPERVAVTELRLMPRR